MKDAYSMLNEDVEQPQRYFQNEITPKAAMLT